MEGTLVVVHCYAGDKRQVVDFLPRYLHHGYPVLVLSPEDAPVHILHPQVICRQAGQAGWKGAHTVYRQVKHWKLAAEYEPRWVLLHDADSVCLTPQLPEYLFADPETFWSNEIGHHYLNYEPPYFMSGAVLNRLVSIADDPDGEEMQRAIGTVIRNDRRSLERLLAAVERLEKLTPQEVHALDPDEEEFPYGYLVSIMENPTTLREELAANIESKDRAFPDWGACNAIDGFYVAITSYAGLRHRSYPDGLHGVSADEVKRKRARLIHGVKDLETLDLLVRCYAEVTGTVMVHEEPQPAAVTREQVAGLMEGERISG